MIEFDIKDIERKGLKILCLGAHSDDIEIGCGGTILKILNKYSNVEILWIVLSSRKERAIEAQKSAEIFLVNASKKEIVVKNFRDGYFPYNGDLIKDYFEELKNKIIPDIIFTHYRNDMHQDHRLVSQLTWNTFRKHLILEYEIIKYDGDIGQPNVFINLDSEIVNRKVKILLQEFKSQNHRDWFTEDSFVSIMRIRGIECYGLDKYAEGFHSRKISLF